MDYVGDGIFVLNWGKVCGLGVKKCDVVLYDL